MSEFFTDICLLRDLLDTTQRGNEEDEENSEAEEEKVEGRNTSLENDRGDEKILRDNKSKNPYTKLKDSPAEFVVCKEEYESVEQAQNDWKKAPKWDIKYKQSVSASDVYLQLGAKTPSTASCEEMVITIELPGEKMRNIETKVVPNELTVISPNFCVKLPLPHPVDPQLGNAKWDSEKEQLSITLTMRREFDFINF